MKFISFFFVAVIVLLSCRPAKKVQKIQEAISKKDTTAVILLKENTGIDSAEMIHQIYKKVIKNNINFNTFNAKVKVAYEGKEGGDEATASIRLKKDSAIWLSLRGALGIEGFRVLITKDSVKVMNLLKKNVQFRSINYLQEITDLPFDFSTLQDLIVGNPVFIDTNIVSYKVNGNNELLVLMNGQLFKHLLSLNNDNYTLLHSKLDDIDVTRNRTCDITFSDYENGPGPIFSTYRKISVAERSKLDIELYFKQYSFNQPVSFPFSIGKNYKRL